MNDDVPSPEQRRDVEAMYAELEAHLRRVGVDLRDATPRMHEISEPVISNVVPGDTEDVEHYTMSFMVDVSGILETLRGLPDGAGTSAFVAAYNRAHPDWRDGQRWGREDDIAVVFDIIG